MREMREIDMGEIGEIGEMGEMREMGETAPAKPNSRCAAAMSITISGAPPMATSPATRSAAHCDPACN
ncbi:MAG: hypothetical protein U1F49_18925 [Rubrivivax sp.]